MSLRHMKKESTCLGLNINRILGLEGTLDDIWCNPTFMQMRLNNSGDFAKIVLT